MGRMNFVVFRAYYISFHVSFYFVETNISSKFSPLSLKIAGTKFIL